MVEGVFGQRHGQQIIDVARCHAVPAEMLRHDRWRDSFCKPTQFSKVRKIQRSVRTQTETDTMQADRQVASDSFEDMKVLSAVPEVFLTMFFYPVDGRQSGKKVRVVCVSQPNADAR